jgi:predicted TIM-barrel fold metal-dependent hydrolase
MPYHFLVSADGHIVEPPDLYRTRLRGHLRHRAMWEEDFEIEPMGDDGYTHFAKLHTPGFEGWTYSRYLHHDGSVNFGQPDKIIADMDSEGIHAQLMHPNLSLQTLFTDDHELSMAHARVYNDHIAEAFSAYRDRVFPTAPIPLTDLDDAVAEIDRAARLGSRVILLPAIAPMPYYSRELDRVWAAASAHRLRVAMHVATGGVKIADKSATTLLALKSSVMAQNQPLTEKSLSDRLIFAAAKAPIEPQTIIASLVGGGVLERFPDLQFLLIEFNANWLAATMAAMDKAWVCGIGQNRD